MTFADYMEQVKADAVEAIKEGAGWHEDWDGMSDELFIDDAVTGNGSGSYTFDAAQALGNIRGLLGDEAFMAEAAGMGYGIELFGRGPECVDVIARCIALGCLSGELEDVYEAAREGSAA